MKFAAQLLIAATLLLGSGCAKTDWIDRTLVTVDVTGTWSGSIMVSGSGGASGARDVEFELNQQGSTVKGLIRANPRGQAPGTIEGIVAGDIFRFRDPRGVWEGELTVSGDEMNGRVSLTGSSAAVISLRRVDPSSPRVSPPR